MAGRGRWIRKCRCTEGKTLESEELRNRDDTIFSRSHHYLVIPSEARDLHFAIRNCVIFDICTIHSATWLAEILTNESEKSGEWMTLWKGPAVELRNVGISMVRPGKYDTLCGDDPSACNPETPKSVDFEHND